jgi:hypothetical protein
VRLDTLRQSCVFASVGSTGPIVYFGTSELSNVDALFFMLRWDRYEFDKKYVRTCYAKLVFLYPVGSAVLIVLSGASGVRSGNTQFLCSSGLYAVFLKSASGHVTSNLCFCIRWDLWVT